MLYGYVPAVITGFLFTAIPNWTGRLPIQGKPLLFLVVVWIAGRLCVTLSAGIGWFAAMAVDVSFLLLVVAFTSREILAGRNWRNLNVVAARQFAEHGVGSLCARRPSAASGTAACHCHKSGNPFDS